MGGARGTQREEVLPGRGSWPAPARAVGSYPPSGTRSRRQGTLHGAVWWRFPGRAVPLGLGPPLSCLAPARSSSCCESQSLESGKLPICTPDCTLMRSFSLLKVDTSRIVHIHSVIILRRSDKRKDRVEISPEQLSAASTEAEISFSRDSSKLANVRTQAMYQMMDQGFVGLIFSCFIEDKNTKTGRILYTCFQSIQAQKSSEYERIEIPIHVVPHETIGKVCLESAVELPKILCQEEQDAYRRIHSLTHLDSVTKIHNGSVFTKNLCSQMSAISGPLLQWLEDRLEQNKQRVQELQQEKEQLLEELAALE
ncbi:lys-63-specific deubiquitinase BRCC36 isoform X2 [Aquila chrysaetos chrysaetos]|uniref:lys-63-specific deubiquitinase BRCC36 isoform X2 n=1 Tax=Aquila chrysaetos chrysaetos TaxID=223781 RepID=UPI001B7D3A0C|nr:lys-63-specific deubiquitinase BRCC36 isoform X2 [Aquila chrysaetos chrysaetos]